MVNGCTSGAMRQLVRIFQDGTLAGLSDREVLGRFVDDRDQAAFEVLLGRHGPMVLNVCRQVLRDPDDAEDAFQATFLALACKASALRVGESLGPWLYRVANRVAARAGQPPPACRSRAIRRRDLGAGIRGRPGSHRSADGRARGARSPARAAPGADRPVLPGRDDSRAGRATAPLPGGNGAQPDGPRPRPAPRADLEARGRRFIRRVGAVLVSNGHATAVTPHIPSSLVKVATQLAAGTASLRSGCGLSARVAALLEGVLNVLRAKQLASAMAALAVIGVVATVVGLSVFSASGQTGDQAEPRPESKRPHPVAQESEKPAPLTYVKTYYVGDLIIPVRRVPMSGSGGKADMGPLVNMSPVLDLITSTVARGTWTVHVGRDQATIIDGGPVETGDGVAKPKTVGHITPFFLSISLIVRHTPEVHDEVANLLRKLRRLQESWQPPEQTHDPKPAPPAHNSPPDRNARIRQLLDELRQEIEKLPKDKD